MSSKEQQSDEEIVWTENCDLNCSSDNEEHITSDELINRLSILVQNIKDEKFTSVIKQDIYDALEEYITGIPKALDPEAMQYLFRGWWMTDTIRRLSEPNYDPTQTIPLLPNCPFCLQQMPPNEESEIIAIDDNLPKEELSNK